MPTWLVVTGNPETLQEVLENLRDGMQATVIANDAVHDHVPDAQILSLLMGRGLNERDAQIVAYSFAGYGRRRIEGILGISSRTLRRAWRRIAQTFDVPDRAALHKVVAVLLSQTQP